MAIWNLQKLGEIDRLCTIGLPDGYPSNPRKQTISIHKTVSLLWYQLDLQFCHDGSFCTAIIRFLSSFCQLEFLYDFGVGHALSSGVPYTFIPTSSSRKTNVEG